MHSKAPFQSQHLSEVEAVRYLQREDMLIEFAKLFDYQEASDRAIAIVGPAYLDTLLSEILTEFMMIRLSAL